MSLYSTASHLSLSSNPKAPNKAKPWPGTPTTTLFYQPEIFLQIVIWHVWGIHEYPMEYVGFPKLCPPVHKEEGWSPFFIWSAVLILIKHCMFGNREEPITHVQLAYIWPNVETQCSFMKKSLYILLQKYIYLWLFAVLPLTSALSSSSTRSPEHNNLWLLGLDLSFQSLNLQYSYVNKIHVTGS